jgi:lysozyme family protein
MAAGNFDACLPVILKHEGGYVDDKHDPGGATNRGVTIGTLSGWLGRPATKAEVRALTVADVTPIYRKNYWNACGCDALPAGVDLAVFDPAVNSGPGRAKQWYAKARQASAEPVPLVRRICDVRMGFLQALRTWGRFGKGWASRVADIRARAEAMARKVAGQSAATVRTEATAEASRAAQAARKAATQSKTITTAAASSPAAPAAAGADWTLIVVVILAVAVPLAFLALRAWHRSRYEAELSHAYLNVAAEVAP